MDLQFPEMAKLGETGLEVEVQYCVSSMFSLNCHWIILSGGVAFGSRSQKRLRVEAPIWEPFA